MVSASLVADRLVKKDLNIQDADPRLLNVKVTREEATTFKKRSRNEIKNSHK
jgi:hypothetical protein